MLTRPCLRSVPQAIVSTDADGTMRLWDIRKVAEITAVPTSQYPANGAVFDTTGKIIAVACDDSVVRCYDMAGALQTTMTGHTDAVQCLAFGSNSTMSNFLVTGSSDTTVRTWS